MNRHALILCNIYCISTATVVAMNVPQYYIACPVIDFSPCLDAIIGIVTQNIPRLECTRFQSFVYLIMLPIHTISF
jgi:hypothetical protein